MQRYQDCWIFSANGVKTTMEFFCDSGRPKMKPGSPAKNR